MNDSSQLMNAENLLFFGKVNASISHELKNILAIISETSGFLRDLTDLAKQGKELKIDLLESCCESINEDVQRGFSTIKTMNQFAHSVDYPIKEIDLVELLRLIVHLTGFLSYAGKVYIENDDDGNNHDVLTSPFLLQNLIYQSLIFIFNQTGSNNKIKIQMITGEEGTCLIFNSTEKLNTNLFETPEIKKAAQALGIAVTEKVPGQEFKMLIPYASSEIKELADRLQIERSSED